MFDDESCTSAILTQLKIQVAKTDDFADVINSALKYKAVCVYCNYFA
jgi:hypothetical protein